MSQVVAEGVSSVLVWDRAKAFLDNGNYQQAALGLRQVVELQPSNIDAHHQLATAYGNLGQLEDPPAVRAGRLRMGQRSVASHLHLHMGQWSARGVHETSHHFMSRILLRHQHTQPFIQRSLGDVIGKKRAKPDH